GIAAVGLFSISSMSAVGNTRANDRIAATALAVDRLEQLRDAPFDSLVAATSSDGALTASGAAGGIYARTWTIADATVGTLPAKTITVSVSWPEEQTVTVSTQRVEPSLVTTSFATAFPTVGRRGWKQVR
ncbi:MAG: hypothetical protein ACREQY_10465, partial [Candidatus Binatia bacterium]